METPFVEYQAQVSPDGRWVAYTSNESGRFEVYAQRFPLIGNKVRLSTAGGVQPRWSDAGTELFYVALDLKLMAVKAQHRTLGAGRRGSFVPDTHLGRGLD